jgi:hypothetical protein
MSRTISPGGNTLSPYANLLRVGILLAIVIFVAFFAAVVVNWFGEGGDRTNHATSALSWLLGIVLGVILTIVLTIMLTEPIQSVAARAAAGFIPRSPRNLTGLWRLEYEYLERGVKKKETQILVIRSIVGAVYGWTVSSQAHNYKIRGWLRQELYFTGCWYSVLPGQAYHGVFMLVLHPDGSELFGKTLGNGEKLQAVNPDSWVWKRLSHKVTRAERNKFTEMLKAELESTVSLASPDCST